MIPDNQTGCSILGCDRFKNAPWFDITNFGGIIRIAISGVFALIIAYGIFLLIKAVIKIIRSGGDETKMVEGYSIIKGVWIGIAIIFFGIVGLVLVVAFFNAGSIVNTNPVLPNGINIPL